MAAPPKAFMGPGSKRCLVYDGELYFVAPSYPPTAAIRKRKPVAQVGRDTLQKLQRVVDTVDSELTKALVKHQELEAAAIWDKSIHLAAQACSSWPELFMRSVLQCYNENGTRLGNARLLDEVARLFMEGLEVYGCPLGRLPPLDLWPAPCLFTWEVAGSFYLRPSAHSGLAEYLDMINGEDGYLIEQQGAWMRLLKPLMPRFIWLRVKEQLLLQKKALEALAVGSQEERLACRDLVNARREANLLGDFEDPTLAEAHQAKSRAYQELQQRNAGLLDWYRLASFALTGHTASTRRQEEFPTQPTLSCSVFGVDCLPDLTTSIDPFFVKLDGICAPAWGVFWEWVLTGGLKEWLPKADSLEQSLELLRDRELRVVSQQWDNTADADRFELLRRWLTGPGAIYPARVAGLRDFSDMPPVSQAAPINRQLRALNPWRADCNFAFHEEALFGLPLKSVCHLCAVDDINQLSSLRTDCAHSACSVCYTLTFQESYTGERCPVRCGGNGSVSRPARVGQVLQFVEASLV